MSVTEMKNHGRLTCFLLAEGKRNSFHLPNAFKEKAAAFGGFSNGSHD